MPFVVVAKKHCAQILATMRALLYGFRVGQKYVRVRQKGVLKLLAHYRSERAKRALAHGTMYVNATPILRYNSKLTVKFRCLE